MLVTGSGGFATQLVDTLTENYPNKEIIFFDDFNPNHTLFLNKFKILNSYEQVEEYFYNVDNAFVLGIGGPKNRKQLFEKFTSMGGKAETVINKKSTIGKFNLELGVGSAVLANSIIESTVKVGTGSLINIGSSLTHGVEIGDFCEISPGAILLGNCKIGNGTMIGGGTIILPNIIIGSNVIVGAGSVVTKNIEDNKVVYGNPAK